MQVFMTHYFKDVSLKQSRFVKKTALSYSQLFLSAVLRDWSLDAVLVALYSLLLLLEWLWHAIIIRKIITVSLVEVFQRRFYPWILRKDLITPALSIRLRSKWMRVFFASDNKRRYLKILMNIDCSVLVFLEY